MHRQRKLTKKSQWLMDILPGITIIGIIITARLLGFLQAWELANLDLLLRLRPLEPIDERIVIIGINETDIQKINQYPVSDEIIADLIRNLQQYNPRAIGLDIVRDISVAPGHEKLVRVFQNSKNIIGIEKVLPPGKIRKPPHLPSVQVGFSDVIPDADGRIRRSLLGTFIDEHNSDYRFSFSLRLAEIYLASEGITLENGRRDKQTMGFGETELPRLLPSSGGYVEKHRGGVQVLLNYRNGKKNFRVFSLQDLRQGKIKPQWLQNRLILIGMMTTSIPDIIYTTAVHSSQVQGEIYGVEFQAHAISQIISAVLNDRPLLKTVSDGWEYTWIILWGVVGIYLSRLTTSPLKNLITLTFTSFNLVLICYFLLCWGWWISLIPALLALYFNGIILTSFYLAKRSLLLQLTERKHTIEETFRTIHNGPLQTLAVILQNVRQNHEGNEKILQQLESLNQEIRAIGEYLQQESLSNSENLRLGSGLVLDLKCPLNELFYQVFNSTINRDLPCFKTLKFKIRSFDPVPVDFKLEQKRAICQFFEEALCNVGKHAQGVIKIEAIGMVKEKDYILSIKDNGIGQSLSTKKFGTKQGERLAKKLGGKFNKQLLHPKGILCELYLPINTRKNFFSKY